MPATIHLRLRTEPGTLVHPARLHGAACALLERPTSPHHLQRKPFSVWPLYATAGGTAWRLGWLADRPARAPQPEVRFGPARCPVLEWRTEPLSFGELARSAPAAAAQFRIVSPLFFSRNGRDHPLPDPVLMVRSAIERWNACAPTPLAMPEELGRAVLAAVYLDAMEGETQRAQVSRSFEQNGFVGIVRLAMTRRADDPARRAFGALMRFAGVAGFGAQTTHGFGAAELERLDR